MRDEVPKGVQLRRDEDPPDGPHPFYVPSLRILDPIRTLRTIPLQGVLLPLRAVCDSMEANFQSALEVASAPTAILVATRRPESFLGRDVLDVLSGLHDPPVRRETAPAREHLDDAFDRLATYKLLLEFANRRDIGRHVNEALRQGTVLLWSVLESGLNDLLGLPIRSNAHWLCEAGSLGDSLRSAFGLPKSLKNLAPEAALRVFEERDRSLQKLETLLEVFGAVLPSQAGGALGSEEITRLSSRRNLLVHRAGIVDRRYLRETHEDRALGSLLRLETRDFTAQAVMVAIALLEGVQGAIQVLGTGTNSVHPSGG